MAKDKESEVLKTVTIGEHDSPSSLAQHYYGDASKWQIILDYNHMTKEEWKVGLKIKIPKLSPPLEENPVAAHAHLVKIDIANLEGRKLLQQDVTMLNGVSKQAAQVLNDCLKIISIFDLAMSHYFNVARSLVDSGSPLEAAFLQHGFIPGDAFRGDPKAMDLTRLKNADIAELNFGDESIASELKRALQIKTIRDMALWPPFQSARLIMLSTFDPTGVTRRGEDPEAPSELIPACGNFPTECVYYTSVFLDEIDDPKRELIDLSGDNFEGVSLFPGKSDIQGFDQPAKGGILTYKQSWYAQGVTLGQLLHSLALAPGESTRIAMVDWYRRTGEKTSEEITESEALSQTAQQSRSISEITQAVATEMQHGYNQTSASSRSARAGIGLFGFSAGGSSSSSIATSVSRSFGQRNMAAEMNQNILSSTQQNATAERSRRATIVRECYQEEKETLTTRAVTNYNHMHALTVQYYEVVQVYRVKTELWKAERVLFIPMKEINFGDPRVFARYKELLKAVALNEEIRNKLDSWKSDYADLTFRPDEPTSKVERYYHSPVLQSIEYDSEVEIAKVTIFRASGDPLIIVDELKAQPLKGNLENKIDLRELSEIRFEFKEIAASNMPSRGCTIKYRFMDSLRQINDFEDEFELKFVVQPEKESPAENPEDENREEVKNKVYAVRPMVTKVKYVPQLENADAFDLIEHLQEHLHYSHAIWLSLDPLTLSQLLAGYKYQYEGKPLASQIDPTPVAITGNYLGFRWNFGSKEEEEEWQQRVKENIQPVEAEIPLPSGGVFAEAVLGRFNSAEKLDITRYWNWQDSPIPFTASDIAALSAGGKSEQSTLTPGQLSQPAVTINAAPTLPDPTGMRDMMQAIAVSNMFRDMSNQAATAALAGQGLEIASKGAGEAAEQASENYRTAIKTLGEVAKEVIPLVATKGLSAASISKVGAAANLASKIDEKEIASTDGNGTGNQETVLSSLLGVATKLMGTKETK